MQCPPSQAEFDKFLPVVKVEFALKHASELSDALRERYSALREEDEEAAKTQVTKHVTSGDQEDQVVPQISTVSQSFSPGSPISYHHPPPAFDSQQLSPPLLLLLLLPPSPPLPSAVVRLAHTVA